jgi:hypothetical protein
MFKKLLNPYKRNIFKMSQPAKATIQSSTTTRKAENGALKFHVGVEDACAKFVVENAEKNNPSSVVKVSLTFGGEQKKNKSLFFLSDSNSLNRSARHFRLLTSFVGMNIG